MSNNSDKVPNLDGESRKIQHALGGEDDQYLQRQRMLEASSPVEGLIQPDAAADSQHKLVDKNAHFSQKVYMFPAEFIALRDELMNNWPDFFHNVNPLTGTSPAWCMVHDAPQFIGYCNGATGLAEQLDSGNVAGICKKFLNAFRKARGVGEIQ